MSAVPLKVILMGFNLLLGARGNILMRQSRRAPTSNSVIAPTDAILLPPRCGIKVLRCHLQHCPSSPASPNWWPGQKPQYVRERTRTHTHYHISNPLHAPSGVYWKLQFIHCLLMGGGAWQQPSRPKEWILRPVHSSVAERERKEVFVLFCCHVDACLHPTLPERTRNKNQAVIFYFF